MSYTSNRLKLALLMSLGASKSLRRVWLWACSILFLISAVIVCAALLHEGQGPRWEFVFFLGLVGAAWGLAGLGLLVVAHVVRFIGKDVKDTYKNDEIFER